MIEGLKPYAEYKESGLPWVPRVPSHWGLIPNRAVLKKRKVIVGGNHKNFQLLSLTKGGVIVRDISTGKGKFSSDMGTSQEVRKGDFVFCLFDVPETPRTVGLSTHDGMITSAYTVFEPRKMLPEGVRYLERFYIAMDDRKLLSPLYSGLRNTIPPPRFLGIKTPQPSPDEQVAIVRFLDHANRKIDGFIRAKRKLIGLLNEQKGAIIHRAVTSGLCTDVALKPSGIPWVGDIPKHWEVRPIKHWARINARTLGEATAANFEFHYIDIGAVRTGRLVTEPKVMRFDRAPSRARRVLVAGDTIISTVRTYLKAVWFAGENPVNLVASTGFAVFSPLAAVEPEYLSYVLQDSGFVDQVTANSVGIAYPAIAESVLARLRIAIPPSSSEQGGIVVAIKRQTGSLNTAIARTEREIALMQEYRTRLTADIVTGKLDAREAARHLPDTVEEIPVAIDDKEFEEADEAEKEAA